MEDFRVSVRHHPDRRRGPVGHHHARVRAAGGRAGGGVRAGSFPRMGTRPCRRPAREPSCRIRPRCAPESASIRPGIGCRPSGRRGGGNLADSQRRDETPRGRRRSERVRLPADRGPRPDRRPADGRPGRHRRHDRLVLRPRFDSPSIFASLLDARGRRHFRIAPEGDDYVAKQLYLPDTAILITRFMSEDGVGEVIDFMPVTPGDRATDRHRIVRVVRVVRGTMSFDVECEPRFDYGRARRTSWRSRRTARSFRTAGHDHHPARRDGLTPGDASTERGVRAVLELAEGQMRGVVLETAPTPATPRAGRAVRELQGSLDETADFWRRLARPLQLPRPLARDGRPLGDDAEADDLRADRRPGGRADRRACPSRSAASATGTTATPGSATRSFSVYALLGLGFTDEAEAFVAVARRPRRRSRPATSGAAADHVPRRRLPRPRRGDPRPLRGLPGLAPGAHRQRRRRPAAARHLRRGDGRASTSPTRTACGSTTTAGRRSCEHHRLAVRATGTSPTTGIWETRGGRRTSSTAG